MSVEVVPSIACNLKCSYCYQDPMRLAGNFGAGRVQLDKVIPAIKRALEGSTKDRVFTVFGGEPLLIPRLTLERLWGFGLQEYGRNSVQTNGELIDDDFIRLFSKYKVTVGLSIDGPWPLNEARSDEDGTKRSIENLNKLFISGNIPSLHIILNRHNASRERLPILIDWIKEVGQKLSEIRIHLMEVDTEKGSGVALKDWENETAFLALANIKTKAQLQPFLDMRRLLSCEDLNKVGCTWNACDPYTTPAVQGVDGDGTQSNCGRTNKDGVAYRKATTSGRERLLALHATAYEAGGCKNCRYFFACKGQCPGEGIDGDWRNRSIHCRSYYRVFEVLETEVGILSDTKIKEREHQVLGTNRFTSAHGDQHGDIPHSDRFVLHVPVVGVKK